VACALRFSRLRFAAAPVLAILLLSGGAGSGTSDLAVGVLAATLFAGAVGGGGGLTFYLIAFWRGPVRVPAQM
jgi:hypothetical protein